MSETLLAALLMGLFGGVHCVGMCGGIVGVLVLGLPEAVRNKPLQLMPYLLLYNLGRISSYVALGALGAWLFSLSGDLLQLNHWQQILRVLSGLMLILAGLYLSGWWNLLLRVEKLGQTLWKFWQPLGQKVLPVRHPWQALVLGLVWGWLPCGLVYTALILSLNAGSAGDGALVMLAFGVGTLPVLLSLGSFALVLKGAVQRVWLRRVAGVVVISMGGWMIWQARDLFVK